MVPGVLAGDAPRREGGAEPFHVIDGHVEGRHAQAGEPDGLPEVHPDATPVVAAKRHVPVADASADADRSDPAPRPLDAPGHDVGERRPHREPAEVRVEVAVEVDMGVGRSRSE